MTHVDRWIADDPLLLADADIAVDLEPVSQSAQEALADERAGEVHERLVQLGPPFPPDAQAAELV